MSQLFTNQKIAKLLLEDGTEYKGFSIGKAGICVGEIVFNTSMTGYQEIITDPSYANQIITFSYPHIGNVGINKNDFESNEVVASGIVVHDHCDQPSHYQSTSTLNTFLCEKNIVGVSGIDTRALVTHIREKGAQKACIISGDYQKAEADAAINSFEGLTYKNLVSQVTTNKVYQWHKHESNTSHVVVYDYGVKHNILNMLADRQCDVTVVPADTAYEDVLALNPDGILLSNGPGDPRACENAIFNIKQLLEKDVPLFGICLGYQLLALAMDCEIVKMKFGHHGANHPILNLETRKVYITSQNHGFAVDKHTLPDTLELTFISLFDQTLQGFQHTSKPFFGVQGHPEGSAGSHDIAFLFDEFLNITNTRLLRKKVDNKMMRQKTTIV